MSKNNLQTPRPASSLFILAHKRAANRRLYAEDGSVYARVIDGWLGANSLQILGADFRKSALTFV